MVSRTDFSWDLSVNDNNGKLILVVEISRKINASPGWAAALRRNLLEHRILPKAPYCLMAFPDKFYLWTGEAAYQDQSLPTYTIDPSTIFKPYLERAGVEVTQISSESLEIIIASWLSEILFADRVPDSIDASQQWLVESGLYAVLIGGSFKREEAA